MKDEKDELNFRSEADEVRVMIHLILHTLFGNLMKDERDELNFRSVTDEVRVMILLSTIKASYIRREVEMQNSMPEGYHG